MDFLTQNINGIEAVRNFKENKTIFERQGKDNNFFKKKLITNFPTSIISHPSSACRYKKHNH